MLIVLVVVLALLTMACSCSFAGFPGLMRGSISPSGEIITEEREVSNNVTEVEISGDGYLYFTQGETAELILEGDANYINNIETRVSGDTLIIRPKNNTFFNWFRDREEVTYTLTLPTVEEFSSAGALDVEMGDLTVEDLQMSFSGSSDLFADTIEAENLTISGSGSTDIILGDVECNDFLGKFSGSADFFADSITAVTVRFDSSASYDMSVAKIVASESVSVDASGSADMAIEELATKVFAMDTSGSANMQIEAGEVEDQFIEMSGSGSYYAADLKSETADLDGGGSADFTVWVTDQLTIDGSGSTKVNYYGDPEVEQRTSGSTTIKQLDKE